VSENPPTILVVDDDEVTRQALSIALEQDGFRVLLAGDGKAALEQLQAAAVDLVLLDVLMPGLSGLEVLAALRARHGPQELPVIMITGRDQSEDVVAAFELGANDYVTKPIDFPVVRARIRARLPRAAPAEAVPRASRAMFEPAPGAVIRGKYRLDSRLGHGQFGVVYRAYHLTLERPVAVKLLRLDRRDRERGLRRFEREGITLCRLHHPNAVMVYDAGISEDGTPFLVMELLDGHTLDQELERDGRLSLARAVGVALPICRVLAAAHSQGIIHRDVKPQNVFLHRGPEGEVVKVVDFGIARVLGDEALKERLTLERGLVGTPAYMAPERVTAERYDGRADVYSLGVMLYEMLAGRKPFAVDHNPIRVLYDHLHSRPEPLGVFRPALPAEIEQLVGRMLEKDFEKRPTAAQVEAALRTLRVEPQRAARRPAGSVETGSAGDPRSDG